MAAKMNYATACGSDAGELMDAVNEYIEKGYEPHGSPILVSNRLVQAVVKHYSVAEQRKMDEEAIPDAV